MGTTVNPSGYKFAVSGDIAVVSPGNTFRLKSGSCFGSGATMTTGVVTILTTAVNSGDFINLMRTSTGVTPGLSLPVVTISNGTSFTLTSSSTSDTSTYSWWILKAA